MKNILLWLILPLCFLSAKAQTIRGTFNPDTSNALPAGKPAAAAARTDNQLVIEKTYLHTDRDVYALGDTLWFKAYLVNAQNNKPISSSGNLYVELITPDSARILSREIIRMDNGTGNGDFELPDSISAGKYKLRAYTNWMRNFGDNFIFEKNITILNTQAIPAISDPKVAAKNKAKDKKTATATTTSPAIIKQPVVRFYPEGGSLITGVSSLVAVKAEDGYGKGTPVTGAVLNASGDTVSRFNCDTLGFGLFTLLPFNGQTYHAVVQFKHEAVFNLPQALNKGPAINTRQADSVLQVAVTINDTPGTVKPFYKLIARHGGTALFRQQFQMPGPQALVNINTAAFPEGISAVTLYDEQGKPYCERLIYIHHSDNTGISVQTDKSNYQPKEKVNVNINAQANSNLSLAVVDAGLVPAQADDIVSYLMLQSEVKGKIENARRYFDTTNVNRFKQLDLLLMTQGWRDFVWRRMADTAIRISYPVENSIAISGKVRDEVRNKYLPGLNVSLYTPEAKGNKLFSTGTDSLGRFNIDGLMLYGTQNIRLGAIDNKGKHKGSFMVDTILPLPLNKPTQTNSIKSPVDSAIAVTIAKRMTEIKNTNVNGITQLKEVKINARQTVSLRDGEIHAIWGPDQVFNIKPEDEQYKTLEWYVMQKAQGVYESAPPYPTGVYFMGLVKSSHIIPTFSGGITAYSSTTGKVYPLLFVNGRELISSDTDQLEFDRKLYYSLPIQKFKKIVLRKVANGLTDEYLLYLTLVDNALIDNPGTIEMDIPGYYQARTFYEPAPGTKPSLADYRTTIHWEPNIKTDATGKALVSFYNTIPQTNARVIVQGVSANGSPIVTISDYVINK